jgi:tetratricopeptide (TPR) repeat protein
VKNYAASQHDIEAYTRANKDDARGWLISGINHPVRDSPVHDWIEADDAFEGAIKREPDCSEAYYNRAIAYVQSIHLPQFPEPVLRALQQFLRLRPDDFDGWQRLSAVHATIAQWPEVVRDLGRCIELRPADLDLRLARPRALRRTRADQEAIADFTTFLEANASDQDPDLRPLDFRRR